MGDVFCKVTLTERRNEGRQFVIFYFSNNFVLLHHLLILLVLVGRRLTGFSVRCNRIKVCWVRVNDNIGVSVRSSTRHFECVLVLLLLLLLHVDQATNVDLVVRYQSLRVVVAYYFVVVSDVELFIGCAVS